MMMLLLILLAGNTALSRPICSMINRNLQSWNLTDGIARSLQAAGMKFDLVSGWEYSTSVLDHVKTSNRQGLLEVYKLALSDSPACSIVRAKRPEDDSIVGTVILYKMDSHLAEFVPSMKDSELSGGISSPVISPAVGEYSTLLQGLILLGIRQIKKQGCNACILDYVSSATIDSRSIEH